MEFLGISERQKRALLYEEAVREREKIVDLFQCIERLHELGAVSLRKLIVQDTILSVPRLDRALPFKVDVRELLPRLPVHLIACALAQEPKQGGDWVGSVTKQHLRSTSWHGHLEWGMLLLVELCDLVATLPALAQIPAEAQFQQNVMDLAVLVLLSTAGPDCADCLEAAGVGRRMQEALEHAALVPGCLRALAACTLCAPRGGEPPPRQLGHAQWQALAVALLRQPRASLFLGALCDAVRTLYRMVRVALRAGVASPGIPELAYQAGLAMEWVTELCCTPLFYHRMVLHDPSLAPLLRLIRAGLELHAAPFPPPPYGIEPQGTYRALTTGYSTSKGKGAVELLAARALALLRSLTDFETATFLDQCCGDPVMHAAMRAVACRATFLAGLVLARPPCSICPVKSPGEGQMAVNALQVLEVLADDSNFRGDVMHIIVGPAAAALALPRRAFEAAWCAGEEAATLHRGDFAIEGRPILLGPASGEHLRRLDALSAALRSQDEAAAGDADAPRVPAGARARAAHVRLEAAQRALALFQALGNLHCFEAGRCEPGMRLAFARMLAEALRRGAAAAAAAAGDGGSAEARGAAALRTAVGNLHALHACARRLASDALQQGAALVAQEDLSLLARLAQELERMV